MYLLLPTTEFCTITLCNAHAQTTRNDMDSTLHTTRQEARHAVMVKCQFKHRKPHTLSLTISKTQFNPNTNQKTTPRHTHSHSDTGLDWSGNGILFFLAHDRKLAAAAGVKISGEMQCLGISFLPCFRNCQFTSIPILCI